jgi:hypothetical protein
MQFQPALPHLGPRYAERAAPEQRRLGLDLLEIAADGDGFGQDRAIVQFENRQPLQRIAAAHFGAAVLERAHVDRHNRHVDSFLGQKDAHPARVGRAAAVEQFHRILQTRRCRL